MYNGQMNDCLGCKWNVFCTHQSATLISFILLDAVEALYRDMNNKGVLFSMPPKKQDFGGVLAQFVDSEGAHCSVGAEGGVALRRL